jgi:CheY-like chemotaxis protein
MKTRVLCVDDDLATALILGGIIEDAGWQSSAAASASERATQARHRARHRSRAARLDAA